MCAVDKMSERGKPDHWSSDSDEDGQVTSSVPPTPTLPKLRTDPISSLNFSPAWAAGQDAAPANLLAQRMRHPREGAAGPGVCSQDRTPGFQTGSVPPGFKRLSESTVSRFIESPRPGMGHPCLSDPTLFMIDRPTLPGDLAVGEGSGHGGRALRPSQSPQGERGGLEDASGNSSPSTTHSPPPGYDEVVQGDHTYSGPARRRASSADSVKSDSSLLTHAPCSGGKPPNPPGEGGIIPNEIESPAQSVPTPTYGYGPSGQIGMIPQVPMHVIPPMGTWWTGGLGMAPGDLAPSYRPPQMLGMGGLGTVPVPHWPQQLPMAMMAPIPDRRMIRKKKVKKVARKSVAVQTPPEWSDEERETPMDLSSGSPKLGSPSSNQPFLPGSLLTPPPDDLPSSMSDLPRFTREDFRMIRSAIIAHHTALGCRELTTEQSVLLGRFQRMKGGCEFVSSVLPLPWNFDEEEEDFLSEEAGEDRAFILGDLGEDTVEAAIRAAQALHRGEIPDEEGVRSLDLTRAVGGGNKYLSDVGEAHSQPFSLRPQTTFPIPTLAPPERDPSSFYPPLPLAAAQFPGVKDTPSQAERRRNKVAQLDDRINRLIQSVPDEVDPCDTLVGIADERLSRNATLSVLRQVYLDLIDQALSLFARWYARSRGSVLSESDDPSSPEPPSDHQGVKLGGRMDSAQAVSGAPVSLAAVPISGSLGSAGSTGTKSIISQASPSPTVSLSSRLGPRLAPNFEGVESRGTKRSKPPGDVCLSCLRREWPTQNSRDLAPGSVPPPAQEVPPFRVMSLPTPPPMTQVSIPFPRNPLTTSPAITSRPAYPIPFVRQPLSGERPVGSRPKPFVHIIVASPPAQVPVPERERVVPANRPVGIASSAMARQARAGGNPLHPLAALPCGSVPRGPLPPVKVNDYTGVRSVDLTIPRPTEASARVPLPRDTTPPVKVTDPKGVRNQGVTMAGIPNPFPRRRGVHFIEEKGDAGTPTVVEISDSDSDTE